MNSMPTPTELMDSPELAILAVLSTTLAAAEASLLAINPEPLSPDNDPRETARTGSPAVVWTLLNLIRVLSEQIDFYQSIDAGRAPLARDF